MAVLDITVIDESKFDLVNWRAGAVRLGEVGITGVADMVSTIAKRCAGKDRIGELDIIGHGNAYGMYFGSDWIDMKTIAAHRAQLGRLCPLFAPSPRGIATLGGCKMGQNGTLLLELSFIWNVPVRAYTAYQRPLIPGGEGSETRCYITCTRGSRKNVWDLLERQFNF